MCKNFVGKNIVKNTISNTGANALQQSLVAFQPRIVGAPKSRLTTIAPYFWWVMQQTLVLRIRRHWGQQILIPRAVRFNFIIGGVIRIVLALGALEPELLSEHFILFGKSKICNAGEGDFETCQRGWLWLFSQFLSSCVITWLVGCVGWVVHVCVSFSQKARRRAVLSSADAKGGQTRGLSYLSFWITVPGDFQKRFIKKNSLF